MSDAKKGILGLLTQRARARMGDIALPQERGRDPRLGRPPGERRVDLGEARERLRKVTAPFRK